MKNKDGLTQISEVVYEALLDDLIPEYALDWVNPIFVPGHPCYEEYSRMLAAYERAEDRLGAVLEDRDLDIMVDALLSHGRYLALEMFRLGVQYQKMQSSAQR